jgi:hypothetical protein
VITGKIIKTMNQRDKMRELFRKYGKNHDLIVEKYADAERRGDVIRKRNSHGLASDNYASRLLADGIKKKWI